ncbi:MAG: DUF4160 domain-containing protein [Thermoanaerobaculia bacterium]
MPTVLREGPYRLHFYSNEQGEPAHIHVSRDQATAKFWLKPVRLGYNFGFNARDLRAIEGIISGNERALVEAWNGFFNPESR